METPPNLHPLTSHVSTKAVDVSLCTSKSPFSVGRTIRIHKIHQQYSKVGFDTVYHCMGVVIQWDIIWLVVWNMAFIFHFIYGMSSFPLTNSYFSRWLFLHQPVIIITHYTTTTPRKLDHQWKLCTEAPADRKFWSITDALVWNTKLVRTPEEFQRRCGTGRVKLPQWLQWWGIPLGFPLVEDKFEAS